jgi:hypothetical protein
MLFLRLIPDLEAPFLMGSMVLIKIYTDWEIKDFFWATAEKKKRAWWHQVHEERLHALQTSAWDLCTE